VVEEVQLDLDGVFVLDIARGSFDLSRIGTRREHLAEPLDGRPVF